MIPSKKEMEEALKQRHGRVLFERFKRASAAVCGLGGLGSNIAVSLARAGVGKLILIDFDEVDVSNLNRQQYFVSQVGMTKTEAMKEILKQVSPYTDVETYNVRIEETTCLDFLKQADVICEALDKAETKAMFVNKVLEELPGTYLVAASGMAGLASANRIKSRKAGKNFYLCGDEVSDVEKEGSLFSTGAALCAAHQAHMVLRILAEKYEA